MAPPKPGLRVHGGSAYNAETPPHLLDSPITPIERFFVRNNGEWPQDLPGDPDDWSLSLDGFVERPLSLTVRDLKRRFETVTLDTVVECAGNGRAALDPPVEGVAWGLGAVGCARFAGVRIASLLEHAGVKAQAVYTAHHSPDRTQDGKVALSRGLPLWKACAPETLLAFTMNGEPLPLAHGGPLRLVAPGFPGSAWQKWLSRIEVRDREHDGEKMTGTDYRLPARPLAPGEAADPSLFAVIEDMPVRALVTRPAEGATVRVGEPVRIEGWAWSGHVPVDAVALSLDDGATWSAAALEPAASRWAWRRFAQVWMPERPGPATVVARARDAQGRAQPLDQAWNPRGYCNNGCQRLPLTVV